MQTYRGASSCRTNPVKEMRASRVATRVLAYQQNLDLPEGDDSRLRLTAAYLKTIGLDEAEYLPPIDRETEMLRLIARHQLKQKQLKAAQAALPTKSAPS
jgi:hypothetical protein